MIYEDKCKKFCRFNILWVICLSTGQANNPGETGDLNTNKMYLCEVVSDYWKSHRAVDSADVIDGKFMFELENVQPELYFWEILRIMEGIFFLDGKRIKVQPENVTEEEIFWKVEGFLDQNIVPLWSNGMRRLLSR